LLQAVNDWLFSDSDVYFMSMASGRSQGDGGGQSHVDACVRGSKAGFYCGRHEWITL